MIRRLLFLFCLCFSAQLIASEDKAFFWEVKSNSATVYLLGSIHYADKSFYPLRSEIEAAFKSSDVLVVEVEMNSASVSSYNDLIASEGTYPGNETIKDHVSKETYKALKSQLKKMGMPLELVQKQKPGILVLTLTAVHVMQLGLDPSLGIDPYFISRAKGKKKIIALETTEEQLRIFLDMPNGDLVLRESLYSIDETEELLGKVVDEWKRGDEEKLNQLLLEDALIEYPEFSSIYDRLIYQRNIKMTSSIKKYLKTKGTYFVVIGAAHFIGEKGIVRSLENAGYTVKRL
jgi:uncharacterized protein YbaP (TraB family)